MDKSQREKYLSEISRESSTVGIDLPDEMKINGTKLPVNKIVFKMSSNSKLPDNVNMSVQELKKNLIRERKQLVEKIQSKNNLDTTEANETVNKVNKIDRVIKSLNPDDISFNKKDKLNEGKKSKKWKDFVDKINEI